MDQHSVIYMCILKVGDRVSGRVRIPAACGTESPHSTIATAGSDR